MRLERLTPFGLEPVRFVVVGAASTLLYIAISCVLIVFLHVDEVASAVIAYLASMTVGFLGHKNHTFRSDGPVAREVSRFVVMHACGLAVATGAMAATVRVFGGAYWMGIAVSTLLIPLANYLTMRWWVFRHKPEAEPE